MNDTQTNLPQTPTEPAQTAGVARRRMLLASLGKGGAVAVAVAVPMQSLASIGTLAVTANGKRCTISGTMSNIHSRETVTATCSGWSPAYYAILAKWPNYHVTNNPNAQNSVNGGGARLTNTHRSVICLVVGPATP